MTSTPVARWPWLLLGAVTFGLAHTQATAWYSNQHQYMLHGLAANSPTLARDWLANTRDPTPAFSAGVAFIDAHLPGAAFHVAYFTLLGVYFVALMRLAATLPIAPPPLAFAALIILAHAALVRLASVALVGVDYPWFLQAGVAGQYVLGPALQPSAFGVLLVAAVATFAHDRLALTVACLVGACVMHATYLLPAALLTLGFQFVLIREGRWRAAVVFGAVTLAAVLPVVVVGARTFAPTTTETFAEAQRILVEYRIPHHCVVGRWFDWIAGLQMAWVALALMLLRRTQLFAALALPAVLGVALTLLQVTTQSDSLALLFPWRISVVLVPVATAAIFARAAFALGGIPRTALVALVVVLALGGVWVMANGLGYRTNDDELSLLEFVRTDGADEVYLLPVETPMGGGTRGVFSGTFTPLQPAAVSHQIPVDLQRFRLSTCRPIYVDFKAVPYKDVELLEWRRRIAQCQAWHAQPSLGIDVRDELRRAGVTRVVAPAARDLSGDALAEVYADDHYRVYRVR